MFGNIEMNMGILLVLFSVPFSAIYLYSLFNLYIGRKTSKYKLLIISCNFILLVAYILLLVSIPEYNQVPLILLLLVLLGVVVLGLVGGFLYSPEHTKDRSDKYNNHIKWFGRAVKVSVSVVAVIVGVNLIQKVVTHEIERTVGIRYIYEVDTDDDIDLLGFYFFDDMQSELEIISKTFSSEDVKGIIIKLDSEVIHDSSDESTLSFIESTNSSIVLGENSSDLFDVMTYTFDYKMSDVESVQAITIEIILKNETFEYVITDFDVHIDTSAVTVPIWENE